MSRLIRSIGQKCGCFQRHQPHDRTIYVDNYFPGDHGESFIPHDYPSNRVVSSKYTIWNFIPKNLFEQFRRIANFYFLCVGIIQMSIDSPVSPATSLSPLTFVITVSAIKQGYEDWLRHKADNEVNNSKAYIVRDGQLTQVKSQHIKVGDIVKVEVNDGFPCDLVMLSSQDPEGKCYVTTANLDGETNLKTHYCVPETRKYQTERDFSQLHAFIECQQPITDLYKFVGRITVDNNSESILKSLAPENVLLRGARLKNTPFIYGCAIYTGPDTKMALNSKAKSTKFSRVEKGMNKNLLILLVVVLLEALLSIILRYWYQRQPKISSSWYVPGENHSLSVVKVISDFLGFMMLYNYLIPISLYVTVEIQKFLGSMFIQWDNDMYDEDMDAPARANTSDLNEELGQVEYLFTDKTGTLTENDMRFRRCSVNGVKYEEVHGHLFEMTSAGEQSKPVSKLTNDTEEFFELLALCHTCRVDKSDGFQTGTSTTGSNYEYQSSSPDEKAFVEACCRYGVIFHGYRDDRLEVTFDGEMRRYKLLHLLEFHATRKCMSVIVQTEKDEIMLLCKGAESALLQKGTSGKKDMTNLHVHDYALMGLRTLVLGKKILTDKEYKIIDQKLTEARNTLENRDGKLEEVFDFVENDFHILGAVAVEDKLQEDVRDTIRALGEAGIKMWVLTGDKEETAVNISYSAGHIHSDMEELRLTRSNVTDSMSCGKEINKHIHSCQNSQNQQFVCIVDGATFNYALEEHTNLFRSLCQMCAAVLCCRMTPLQKAEVVKLMKNAPNSPVTAAIGDGANDVSMIQEAHVGLGIMGKEGRQAACSSDYAFAKFHFLKRILLVHGHFFYYRLATLVQYFFYKNVAFVTMQLFYAFYAIFSQQSIFIGFNLMFHNTTFTSMPIFIFSLFEQHISQRTLLEKPHLYRNITRNRKLSMINFIRWIIQGLWHVFVVFFGVVFLFGNDVSLLPDGKMMGLGCFSTILYTICVIIINLKLCLETYYWPYPMFLVYIITAVGNFCMTLTYSMVIWPNFMRKLNDFYKVYVTSFSSITVWLGLIILVIIALLPDIIIRVARDTSQSIEHMDRRVSSKSKSTVPLQPPISSFETRKYIEGREADSDSPPMKKRQLSSTRL